MGKAKAWGRLVAPKAHAVSASWVTPRGQNQSQGNRRQQDGPLPQPALGAGEEDVPDSLKNIDYWKAMEYFDIFDVYRCGEVDERMFYKMVMTICREKELITKTKAGLIFDKIDLDRSGWIDKEEWLGWIFSTFSNYCGTVRRRLSQLDPQKLLSYYRMVDKDGSNSIDKEEFYFFVSKFSPESDFTRDSSDQLFDFIDADKSGGLDIQEFLDWVHPQQAVERKAKKAAERAEKRRLRAEAKGLPPPETFHTDLNRKSTAIFEMPPNTPLTLEFTTGPRFEHMLIEVERLLRNNFDESVLQLTVKIDSCTQGCRKLVALVGRGVVLWDRMRMMPYMEDPFTSITSSRRWITTVLMDTLPDLVKSASLNRKRTDSAAPKVADGRAGSKGSFSLPGSKDSKGSQSSTLAASASAPQLARLAAATAVARPQSQGSQRPQASQSRPESAATAQSQPPRVEETDPSSTRVAVNLATSKVADVFRNAIDFGALRSASAAAAARPASAASDPGAAAPKKKPARSRPRGSTIQAVEDTHALWDDKRFEGGNWIKPAKAW